jgi:cell division protein YceG involved in septum cleavage
MVAEAPEDMVVVGDGALLAALTRDEDYIRDGYLYFCNESPKSTKLVFARTYEEHLANMAAYNAAAGKDTYDTSNQG